MTPEDFTNIIAPPSVDITPYHIRIGDVFVKTIFAMSYPRYLSTGWFSPIINLPEIIDIAFFFHPVRTGTILRGLTKKVTEVEAQMLERDEKGKVRDPILETAKKDIEKLRDELQQGVENMLQVGVYITIYGDTETRMKQTERTIYDFLESRLVHAKPAFFQTVEGFTSTLPINQDRLGVWTPLNTSPASSLFPFISQDLSFDEGIFYGINQQNNSLVIFDRFSLENANMNVFARAGAGKSFAIKLEILRALMTGVDIIVLDPEGEYESLSQAVQGNFFKISLSSNHTINPLEIPIVGADENPTDVLRSHIINLVGLVKIMIGGVSSEEEAVLDQAITETYATHEIAPDKDFSEAEPPLLEDLERVLESMEGGRGLAKKLSRFTRGTYAGFTNRKTNIDLEGRFIVFSTRDLEEELRPIAMYIVLNYVWTVIKKITKRRIMVIDDAWLLMRNPAGAFFVFSVSKRCRKYDLGLTTISQDIEDFLATAEGRALVSNASLQLLLKQSPGSVDAVGKAFGLNDVEKMILKQAPVGNGLFLAGSTHVFIQIVPCYTEERIINSGSIEMTHLTTDEV